MNTERGPHKIIARLRFLGIDKSTGHPIWCGDIKYKTVAACEDTVCCVHADPWVSFQHNYTDTDHGLTHN